MFCIFVAPCDVKHKTYRPQKFLQATSDNLGLKACDRDKSGVSTR